MHDVSRMAALSLVAATLFVPTASAQDKRGTNFSDSDAKPTSASAATDTLMLGYRLADYARTIQDARAMIAAARIVDSVEIRESADKGTIDGAGKDRAEAGAAAKLVTAAGLFAEASTFAAGDPALLAEIAAAQAEATRGPLKGYSPAINTVQYVPAETIWTVRFSARGGEALIVGVRRDTATLVDLKIHDENANLVCQDMSHNVTMYCRVNPIWTGAFSVQVINHGKIGTGAAMITN